MQKPFRALMGLFLVLIACFSAGAFTTHPEGDNNTTGVAWDDLFDVNRWSMMEGSLVEDGVRGLDGGIEYAISRAFCDEISHHFFELPNPSCDEIRELIQGAFEFWSDGNPNLQFVDVSAQVDTALDSFYGSEIDFFALTVEQYPHLRGVSALTRWWWDPVAPIATNGTKLPGRSLKGSDIIFSVENNNCYYHDRDPIWIDCNHFQSLAVHEIGHALGLSHPDEMPQRNFDQDSNPRTSLNIDCTNPNRGFRISLNYDPGAVMNARKGIATPKYEGLSPDDIGGRDFLYPVCDLSKIAVVSSSEVMRDLQWGGQLFIMMAIVGIGLRIRRFF